LINEGLVGFAPKTTEMGALVPHINGTPYFCSAPPIHNPENSFLITHQTVGAPFERAGRQNNLREFGFGALIPSPGEADS